MRTESELVASNIIHPSITPKVTIGICVRNCQNTIDKTIESVMAQDYPHKLVEVIFVNDGSEDETLSIIKSYVSKIDMNVKVFNHKWKGLGYSRNLVINNAAGEYIIWVDGDMVISQNYVKKLVTFMGHNPKVGIAKGKQSLHSGSNILGTLEAYSRSVSRMVDYGSQKFRYKSLGTGGAIYRVKAIKQVGGFDENLKGYCEDWDIEIRIRESGWSLCTVNAEFVDYERFKLTWNELWRRYWLRGYYTHYFLHKKKGLIKHYKMFPPAAFFAGLIHSKKLFALTREKFVFFLPFQYLFKYIAWYVGFFKGHLGAYQPKTA
jgi:glycosyltransferase involved in cell wall biosynthesis